MTKGCPACIVEAQIQRLVETSPPSMHYIRSAEFAIEDFEELNNEVPNYVRSNTCSKHQMDQELKLVMVEKLISFGKNLIQEQKAILNERV